MGWPFVKLKWLTIRVLVDTVHYRTLGLANHFSKSPSEMLFVCCKIATQLVSRGGKFVKSFTRN